MVVHEGGYAEAHVPFCGLAVVETLSGVRTAVEDPIPGMGVARQPDPRTVAFRCGLVDERAESFGH